MPELRGHELNGSNASWPGLDARGEIGSSSNTTSILNSTGNNHTSSSSSSEWQLPHSTATMVTLTLVVSFIILVTIFGNSLVAIAVFTSKSLKAAQNLFLVSLAAADILVATLVMPFSLAKELMGYWVFGSLWCEMYLALDVLFCTSSIVHLCAISLDRYWSVTQAVRYNIKRTPRRVKRAIVIVWVIAALISFPPLVGTGRPPPEAGTRGGGDGGRNGSGPSGERPMCKLNEEAWYVLSSCTASFFAPCLIMLLVYARIYQVAKGRARRRSRGDSERDTPEPPPPPPSPPPQQTTQQQAQQLQLQPQQQQLQQQHLIMVEPQANLLLSPFPTPHHHHPPPPPLATPLVPCAPRQNGQCVRNGGGDDGSSVPHEEVLLEAAEEGQKASDDLRKQAQGEEARDESGAIYSTQASLPNVVASNGRQPHIIFVGKGGFNGQETPHQATVSNGKHLVKGGGEVMTKQNEVVVVMEERNKDERQIVERAESIDASHAPSRTWSSRSVAAVEEEGDAETEAGGDDDDDLRLRRSLSLRNDDERRGSGGAGGGGGSNKLGLCSTKMARRKLTAAREKRFTFVLAVVMGVFVACWFPFFFSYSLKKICPASCTPPDYLFNFFFWFGYCNSSLNPLIYTVFNQDFRRAFKNILCRRRPRIR